MNNIASIAGSISITKGIYQTLTFIKDVIEANVISAYFRYDGTQVDGSEEIVIEIHSMPTDKTIWWYSVKPVQDYVFVRVPVIESCACEIVGNVVGEEQPDARYWRWVAPGLPGRIYGGDSSNLKVDFLVYGYRPKALLKHFATR